MTDIVLGDVLTNARGGKFVPIKNDRASEVEWTLRSAMRVPWEPTDFSGENESSRINLCILANEENEKIAKAIDDAVLKQLKEMCVKVFGKPLSSGEIEQRYQKCFRESKQGCKHIKLKMTLEGRKPTRFWNEKKESIECPSEFRTLEIQRVKLCVRHVWLMANQCGVVIELRDLQVRLPTVDCPFGSDEED